MLQEELMALLDHYSIPAWVTPARALVFGDLSSLEVMVCRRQRRHEHDAGWRINYQRNAGAEFIVAARLHEDASSVKDFLLVPRHDMGKLPVLLRDSHQELLAPYSYESVQAVAKKLADGLRRQSTVRSSAALRVWYNSTLRDSR